MGNLHGRMPTQATQQEQRDKVEYRQRVATYVDGNAVSYEDTNFTSADSPAVMNVQSDLGRPGHKGYIVNDGPGDMQVEFSFDGTTYGGIHLLRGGEQMTLDDLKISKIRVTFVDPTEYRVMVA